MAIVMTSYRFSDTADKTVFSAYMYIITYSGGFGYELVADENKVCNFGWSSL